LKECKEVIGKFSSVTDLCLWKKQGSDPIFFWVLDPDPIWPAKSPNLAPDPALNIHSFTVFRILIGLCGSGSSIFAECGSGSRSGSYV
jgi:hypothetical protein